jgi:hypothetical protein
MVDVLSHRGGNPLGHRCNHGAHLRERLVEDGPRAEADFTTQSLTVSPISSLAAFDPLAIAELDRNEWRISTAALRPPCCGAAPHAAQYGTRARAY